VCSLQIAKTVARIKDCDSGLGEELAQMRELYRREALQRKLLYNQVRSYNHSCSVCWPAELKSLEKSRIFRIYHYKSTTLRSRHSYTRSVIYLRQGGYVFIGVS